MLGNSNRWINLGIKTKTNMKKTILFALFCSFLSHHSKSFAQDDQSVYDQIWSKALLYQEDENSLLSKFVLTSLEGGPNKPLLVAFVRYSIGKAKLPGCKETSP